MSQHNPKKTEQKLRAIQDALARVLPPGQSMSFRGQTADGTVLDSLVSAALAPYDDVSAAKIAHRAAVGNRDARKPEALKLIEDLVVGAQCTFGVGSSECQELGFLPRKKPAPLTSEQNALKAGRARATRKARGTLGPRARLAVKGVVSPEPGSPSGAPPT